MSNTYNLYNLYAPTADEVHYDNFTETEHSVLQYVSDIPNISAWEALTMAAHAMALIQYIETEKELDDSVIETSEIDDMTGTLTDGVNRDLLNYLDESYDNVVSTHTKMMEALGIPESFVTLVDGIYDEHDRAITMWYSLSADATEQQRRNWELRNEFLMAVHRIAGQPLTIYTRPIVTQ